MGKQGSKGLHNADCHVCPVEPMRNVRVHGVTRTGCGSKKNRDGDGFSRDHRHMSIPSLTLSDPPDPVLPRFFALTALFLEADSVAWTLAFLFVSRASCVGGMPDLTLMPQPFVRYEKAVVERRWGRKKAR